MRCAYGGLSMLIAIVPAYLPAITVAEAPATTTPVLSRTDRIEEILRDFHRRAGFPGATIGFSLSDGTVGSVAVGLADKGKGIPMRAAHRMMAGSTGKTLFAALALQLVDQDVLQLDQKISQWLGEEPWFARLPNAEDITLRMLLNHTAGIPRYVMLPDFVEAMRNDPDRRWAPVERLAFVFDREPLFPAGKGWAYADTNFIVVGLIIEKATGDSCYNLISRRILRPHGLHDIIPASSRDVVGLADGYVSLDSNLFHLDRENVIYQGRYVFNPQFEWAGGGFASTPRELARWGRLLYTGDVLSKAMKKEMRTTVASTLGPGSRYGLGLMQRSSAVGDVIGHAGYFPGYLTDMAYYVDRDIALAIQVNTSKMTPEMNYARMRAVLDACAKSLSD